MFRQYYTTGVQTRVTLSRAEQAAIPRLLHVLLSKLLLRPDRTQQIRFYEDTAPNLTQFGRVDCVCKRTFLCNHGEKMIENCHLPNIKSLGLVWIGTRRTSDVSSDENIQLRNRSELEVGYLDAPEFWLHRS